MGTKQIKIEVCHRSEEGKIHACIAGKPGLWSQGDSFDDAIGNLIRRHRDEFGIEIAYLPNETR